MQNEVEAMAAGLLGLLLPNRLPLKTAATKVAMLFTYIYKDAATTGNKC